MSEWVTFTKEVKHGRRKFTPGLKYAKTNLPEKVLKFTKDISDKDSSKSPKDLDKSKTSKEKQTI